MLAPEAMLNVPVPASIVTSSRGTVSSVASGIPSCVACSNVATDVGTHTRSFSSSIFFSSSRSGRSNSSACATLMAMA